MLNYKILCDRNFLFRKSFKQFLATSIILMIVLTFFFFKFFTDDDYSAAKKIT